MTTDQTTRDGSTPAAAVPPAAAHRAGPWRVFLAVLGRDLFVTGKELPSFLAQVLIQPFFFLLIFVVVLGRGGFVSADYGSIMLPGLLALNAMFGALQAVAFPLVFELSYTREIDDRLLSPMPVPLVAVEKMVYATLRGTVASLLMVPIGLAMVDVSWPVSGLAPAAVMIVLGAATGATIGLVIGTAVPPRRIQVLFAVIFTPLLFTGSVQYPWRTLEDLRWFQVLSALNPLTYVSEGLRAALVPQVPHVPLWLCFVIPTLAAVAAGAVGVKGFMRRALD